MSYTPHKYWLKKYGMCPFIFLAVIICGSSILVLHTGFKALESDNSAVDDTK
jgi:hypothetical protein